LKRCPEAKRLRKRGPHKKRIGAIDLEGERYFFKLDYYTPDLSAGLCNWDAVLMNPIIFGLPMSLLWDGSVGQ
jgi:hypothetical protein